MDEPFRGLVPPKGKVALLYQAVLDLLREGRDITTMKVSDITGRAGIGKGTAYEYFSSREEIIVQAVLWDFREMIQEANEAIAQKEDFQDKYLLTLDWIEKRLMNYCTLGLYIKLQQKEQDLSSAFQREFCKHMPDEEVLMKRMDVLVEAGRKDGLIRRELPDAAVSYILLSQFFTFILFLRHREKIQTMTVEEMKKFSLKSFLKIVGD